MLEDKILSIAVKRIWNELPETRYCFYHVASEGKRSPVEWSQLKAKGFIKGIQDIHFVWDGTIHMIEMKNDKGVISKDQKVIHCAHYIQGIPTYIFRDSDVLFDFVKDVTMGVDVKSKYKEYYSPFCYGDLKQLINDTKR